MNLINFFKKLFGLETKKETVNTLIQTSSLSDLKDKNTRTYTKETLTSELDKKSNFIYTQKNEVKPIIKNKKKENEVKPTIKNKKKENEVNKIKSNNENFDLFNVNILLLNNNEDNTKHQLPNIIDDIKENLENKTEHSHNSSSNSYDSSSSSYDSSSSSYDSSSSSYDSSSTSYD